MILFKYNDYPESSVDFHRVYSDSAKLLNKFKNKEATQEDINDLERILNYYEEVTGSYMDSNIAERDDALDKIENVSGTIEMLDDDLRDIDPDDVAGEHKVFLKAIKNIRESI